MQFQNYVRLITVYAYAFVSIAKDDTNTEIMTTLNVTSSACIYDDISLSNEEACIYVYLLNLISNCC